jgi:hypothetical protein
VRRRCTRTAPRLEDAIIYEDSRHKTSEPSTTDSASSPMSPRTTAKLDLRTAGKLEFSVSKLEFAIPKTRVFRIENSSFPNRKLEFSVENSSFFRNRKFEFCVETAKFELEFGRPQLELSRVSKLEFTGRKLESAAPANSSFEGPPPVRNSSSKAPDSSCRPPETASFELHLKPFGNGSRGLSVCFPF